MLLTACPLYIAEVSSFLILRRSNVFYGDHSVVQTFEAISSHLASLTRQHNVLQPIILDCHGPQPWAVCGLCGSQYDNRKSARGASLLLLPGTSKS